ncbi:MAG: DUF3341 domain-containing protein [Chloroflexota bacterium]|nr:DUF3341 domain-containing protein [Chloroflexota bacterium]
MSEHEQPCLYGLVAEFGDEEALLSAAWRTRKAGYHHLRAYTPFPVDGLPELLGKREGWLLPLLALLGGLTGAIGGYVMQYYSAVIAWPLNVAGRPYNSWPAFIPVTIGMIILFAAVTVFIGMLVRNGLPQPYHPIFNVPEFELASQSRFFLCILVTDPKFHMEETRRFLLALEPNRVREVGC